MGLIAKEYKLWCVLGNGGIVVVANAQFPAAKGAFTTLLAVARSRQSQDSLLGATSSEIPSTAALRRQLDRYLERFDCCDASTNRNGRSRSRMLRRSSPMPVVTPPCHTTEQEAPIHSRRAYAQHARQKRKLSYVALWHNFSPSRPIAP